MTQNRRFLALTNLLALLLSAASAYAFSFALDLMFGAALGVYSATAYLAVATWSFVAMVTGLISLRLSAASRVLVIPHLVIVGLAVVGGLVGHPHDFLVAGGMLMQAWMVWRATAPVQLPHQGEICR